MANRCLSRKMREVTDSAAERKYHPLLLIGGLQTASSDGWSQKGISKPFRRRKIFASSEWPAAKTTTKPFRPRHRQRLAAEENHEAFCGRGRFESQAGFGRRRESPSPFGRGRFKSKAVVGCRIEVPSLSGRPCPSKLRRFTTYSPTSGLLWTDSQCSRVISFSLTS